VFCCLDFEGRVWRGAVERPAVWPDLCPPDPWAAGAPPSGPAQVPLGAQAQKTQENLGNHNSHY